MNALSVPYGAIVDDLLEGAVVPFFGAAASAAYRGCDDRDWEPGKAFFPFGHELAGVLARDSGYAAAEETFQAVLGELATVAAHASGADMQAMRAALEPVLRKHVGGPPGLALIASFYVNVQTRRDALDRKLSRAFEASPEPSVLHHKLAALEKTPLYVTTNYDDLLERALSARGPHILVDRRNLGLALRGADGALEPIDRTGKDLYNRLDDPKTKLPSKPILFKMHGSIDRTNRRNGSFLITEEDYVDYLGRDGGNSLPPYISGLMQGKTLLFLGYSLEDWNVRVTLRKLMLATGGEGQARCWAIVQGRSEAEQRVWQSQGVNIYPMNLLEFSDRLVAELDRRG